MPSNIPPYMFLIFIAATAVGVLLQAGILLGMFLVLRGFQVKVGETVKSLTDLSIPLIASSKATIEDLGPKLKVISSNLVDVSETLKQESKTIKVSVDDVLARTRAQTARVDDMVSGTLDGISHASATIQHGISVPLRQLNGLASGVRAGLQVLLQKRPGTKTSAPTVVEETTTPVVIVTTEEIVISKIS